MTDVFPPDASVWWDPATIVAGALDQLRLGGSDVDAARVAALVEPAGQILNTKLDRVAAVPSPAPAPLVYALTQGVVEMYRNKDAPTTSVDGMMMSAWRPGAVDPFAGVDRIIAPYRQRMGVG